MGGAHVRYSAVGRDPLGMTNDRQQPQQAAMPTIPPGIGAVVMATGVVSLGLALDGEEGLSSVLLAIALFISCPLAGVVAWTALRRRRELLAAARTPAALTAVAATDVVGTRLAVSGWAGVAAALLALAVLEWLVLTPRILANCPRRTAGVWFLLTVATESIAVLCARLAIDDRLRWLALFALAWLGLGVLLYVVVLVRFDARQLLVGLGDQWVAGGALAITALACARCAQAAGTFRLVAHGAELSRPVLAIWVAAVGWIPVLVVTEMLRRRLGYQLERWSTVFPLGMYAVCSLATGTVANSGALTDVGRVVIWIAFAIWLVVFAGMLRRVGHVLHSQHL